MIVETEKVEVSRHKCLIYDGHPAEQLPIVIPLLVDGLRANERCLYLGSPEMVDMVDAALADRGVDIAAEARRGALIRSSDRAHLQGGEFDPQSMVATLVQLIDDAVRDGFHGLCATGDMMWELGTEKNFDRLLEYEALLEKVFREKPLRGVCQYNRNTVPRTAIRDALLAHRSVHIGDELNRDNLFYVPPELLLGDSQTRNRQGEWMCQQITRILDAERKRDQALTALRASEAEQRRLAADLAETNRHLERRVQERTAELETVNKELEAFSYSVSHDLRAPLRHIDGFSQALAEDFAETLGQEGCKQLERIRAGTRRMGELIEGMLTLAHFTKREMRREPIDLSALAKAVAEELQKAEPHRQVELAIQKGLRAFGDRSLLRAALDNLLRNAWKFTAKAAQARIDVGRSGEENGNTVFFVSDNGAGFDMAYAQKLFGVFERLHSQEEFQGTGVGLATVQRIILRHGGRIWAKGSPEKGATFFFSLPKELSSCGVDASPFPIDGGRHPSNGKTQPN